MAGALTQIVRTYPVTIWLGVGVFAYAWKASLVVTAYNKYYGHFAQQRQQELNEIKWFKPLIGKRDSLLNGVSASVMIFTYI